jgi:ribonuclease T1
MRRKIFIAVAAVTVVGLFLWSQQPRHAPVHENVSVDAPSASGASTPDQTTAERKALETPPPLTLPSDDDTARGTSAADSGSARSTQSSASARYPNFLPKEAIATLRLIERDGPYPYRQDDGVFQNRERKLPPQPRGYYREYTVKTPGSRDRGARRIVAGGRPPVEYFYTDDHYRSFRRFTLDGDAGAGRTQ